MNRRGLLAGVGLVAFLSVVPAARADAFDRYTNSILSKAVEAGTLKEVEELTPELVAAQSRVLPDSKGVLLVVRTNENRLGKLLVQMAGRKSAGKVVPMLLVERFVTYKEGTEREIQAQGRNVHLYPGTRLDLDFGQVVPAKLGGDLLVPETDARAVALKPLGKAKLYLVTKALPGAAPPKKPAKLEIGSAFAIRYFNGTYKLYDDGRKTGLLTLRVDDAGDVTGTFTSDKDGRKYEVTGKVGRPEHALAFTVKFPATEQTFQGWLFTGDGKALTGSSKVQDRETGFYAVRVED